MAIDNPKSLFTVANYLQQQLNKGKTKSRLEKKLDLNKYYINKHLLLLTWPDNIIKACLLYPNIFTPRLIFNTFASRQKYYSKNGLPIIYIKVL